MVKTLTEEHKRKIGLANSIALKGKHCSPNTEFKKGRIGKVWTDEEKAKVSREKSPFWKGGRGNIIARKICQDNGRDLTTCQICKDKGKMIVHHCDGNINNNSNFNLGIVCSYCHFAIHDNQNKRATRFQEGHEFILSGEKGWFQKGHIPHNKILEIVR